MTARPKCPTCSALVHTAQPVFGGLAVAYPCCCWLHPDVADAMWRSYPEVYRPERTPTR